MTHVVYVNLICNAVYTLLYMSFLTCYAAMNKPPSFLYTLGVILYTVGYASFVVSGCLYLARLNLSLFVAELIGDLGFFLGSVVLAVSTKPHNGQPWLGHSASLFWGSVLFLIGSGQFVVATTLPGLRVYKPIFVGYCIFIVGRFFFVDGSSYGKMMVTKKKLVKQDILEQKGSRIAGLQSHFLHRWQFQNSAPSEENIASLGALGHRKALSAPVRRRRGSLQRR